MARLTGRRLPRTWTTNTRLARTRFTVAWLTSGRLAELGPPAPG
ncbi:hypothetical protein ACFQV2_05075 [Actinokineospora soli]|uniref:Uncharacterized protein n=1 Tax=Actinokineospora soli TaxID=1048753 RepID=A0ABW2TIP9_9PSEU